MGGQSKNIPMKMDAQLLSVDFRPATTPLQDCFTFPSGKFHKLDKTSTRVARDRQKHSFENICYSRAGKARIRRYQVRAATLN
jgi:hypothetical protein